MIHSKRTMVKIIITFVSVITLSLWAFFNSPSTNNYALHHQGTLSQPIQNIFGYLGQSMTTLSQANEFAQKNLLRTGERWDKQEENILHSLIKQNKQLIIDNLTKIGMIDQICPEQKQYDYVLVMGGLKATFSQKLDYLVQLFDKGYTCTTIVLLAGARPLQALEKSGLPETIETEAQMMEYVYLHSDLKNHAHILVTAPMIKKGDGTLQRPNTDDTLRSFIELNNRPGSCLVISFNPYIMRQTKVAQNILTSSGYQVTGAGRAADLEKLDIIMLMDELARTIFEETKAIQ